jgi:formylglycine-generating enzyme required for sulfatase activity
MYPQGVSLVGALNMSGNLREYCLNAYDNPKRIEVSGENSPALRGGGRGNDRGFARCAYRKEQSKLPGQQRGFSVGLRVPHLLSHSDCISTEKKL